MPDVKSSKVTVKGDHNQIITNEQPGRQALIKDKLFHLMFAVSNGQSKSMTINRIKEIYDML
ncbi:hypothetical protein V6R21_18990 [Limibacter armeniacum]|uniref:hypothetical protein n=1 Tax=Limibacter armeniacum TaxID=466084 RepID=UPI002FE64677